MNIFKTFISAGLYYLENNEADFDTWSHLMLRDFGQAVKPRLREIRQWSLLLACQRAGPQPEKMNCWEFTHCGRQVHGEHVKELGTCPAPLESRLDGMHGGKNGGRACWVVAGTLCGGKTGNSVVQKRKACRLCNFYGAVKDEEGPDGIISDDTLMILTA